ncbi:DUF961 domain-containing protein [Sellimonas caecigallum]|uniref:DUF961 domain-containing protein n=1 Tax=Sellimonas caecigallum TaxID=2592333 RepID=A0ABS7L453_9FIRM|nr:DUF961 domain-containing protein [Sellimonas caecigallum]
MIQISIPASVPRKQFDHNVKVEFINFVADTVANSNYRGTIPFIMKMEISVVFFRTFLMQSLAI